MLKMKRQPFFLLNIALVSILIAVSACSRETPAQQTNSISQKIEVQKVRPESKAVAGSTTGKQAQARVPARTVLPASVQQAAAAPVAIKDAAPDQPAAAVEPVSAEPSELIKESLQIASTYDPSGRFDPFEPLFKQQSQETNVAAKSGHKKRKPQTPLERIALSQLKLTAIIRAPSGNRAMVEDATGKGYVIKRGTYVGLNAGRVTEIDDDRVVVEEEIENLMGELTLQNAELKLQKPAGEL